MDERLKDCSNHTWYNTRFSDLRPEIQAVLDRDELQYLAQPAHRILYSGIESYHEKVRDDMTWYIDKKATEKLLEKPLGFLKRDDRAGLSLAPGQRVVLAMIVIFQHCAQEASNWSVRLVLDPDGKHRVLQGTMWGSTFMDGRTRLSADVRHFKFDYEDLATRATFHEDPDKEFEFVPPYPLEDDMHAELKEKWLQAARIVYERFQDPAMQAQFLALARKRVRTMADKFQGLPLDPERPLYIPDSDERFVFRPKARPAASEDPQSSA